MTVEYNLPMWWYCPYHGHKVRGCLHRDLYEKFGLRLK